MNTIVQDVVEVLGLEPGEAETKATELGSGGLAVAISGDVYRYQLQSVPWINALERLRGRYTGDHRHPDWQNHPALIGALLPGAVTSLLSKPSDEGIALVVAIAAHVAGGLISNRLHGVAVIHGPLMTRCHLVHRQQSGFAA